MKKRIRIMFVTHDMSSGGAERKINNIIWHLDRDKFDVHLVLHRRDVVFPLPESLSTYDLDMQRSVQVIKGIRRLRRLIREIHPNLIISSALNPALLCAEAMFPMAKRPISIAMIANNPKLEPGWRQHWARRSYRIFDYFISSCDLLRTIFLETYPFIRAERVLIWNTSIDVERIMRQASAPTDEAGSVRASLIALGRLCKQKRYDVLLEAFAQVRLEYPVDLIIFGDGPLRHRLQRQAKALGVTDFVFISGFSVNPHPALAAADICLMSSDYEGTPNVLLEAQALGVPIVSTNCPTGPSEIIVDGETGLLVERDDPKALAKAICKLLGDKELRNRMKAKARMRVFERFDVHVSIPKLEAHLETIAAVPYRQAVVDR